jgi:hypothetical protein
MTTPDKNKAPKTEFAPPVVASQPAPGNEPNAFVFDPMSGQITSVPAAENGSSAASRIGTFDPVSGKITFS